MRKVKIKDLKIGDVLLVARSDEELAKIDKALVEYINPSEQENTYDLGCKWIEGESFRWSVDEFPGDVEVTLYEEPKVRYEKVWAPKLQVGDVIAAAVNKTSHHVNSARVVKIESPRHKDWFSVQCLWIDNLVYETFDMYRYSMCMRLEKASAEVEEPEETSQEPEEKETEKMQDKLVFKYEDSVDGATIFNNAELLLPFREYPAGTQLLHIISLGDNVGLYSETRIETISLKSSQMAFRSRLELASCEDVDFLAQVAFEASKIGQGSSRNDVGTQDLWKAGWKEAWKALQGVQEPQNSKSDMDEIFEDL